MEDNDLNQLLASYQANKLSAEQRRSLDGPLTYEEISLTVKQMKNNKTPGIDEFPVKFFTLFWNNLSQWIFSIHLVQNQMIYYPIFPVYF